MTSVDSFFYLWKGHKCFYRTAGVCVFAKLP